MTLAPEGRTEIDLVDGSGCACCAVDSTTDAAASVDATDAAGGSLAEASFGVAGMTCGNCVAHVTEELTAIDGVDAVEVELVNGGVSGVIVRSSAPISDAAIAAAVEEAGYRIAER
jgi:copper chaperone